MISFEQRIALVNAGYTAEQISEFEKEQKPEQQPQQEQKPEQQPQQEQKQEQQEQNTTNDEAIKLVRQLLESNKEVSKNMALLTASIQANAIASASMPGGSGIPTAEDALASIIAPKPIERK